MQKPNTYTITVLFQPSNPKKKRLKPYTVYEEWRQEVKLLVYWHILEN